jgi:DNA-binding transcriptional regulator YdaS (Cro superfamily)
MSTTGKTFTFARKTTLLERRQIKAAAGSQLDIAKEFGVSTTYVCMLKSGRRQVAFTPVEVFGASLITMACGGEL